MASEAPGRCCPASYGYGARALGAPASVQTETLYVAGGLYGNPEALERLLELYAAEPGEKALVFNGDFHWFDIDPRDFSRITEGVLAHLALRGNVETELATPASGAGCGCHYPDWVGDADVERSNRILERLRGTAVAFPELVQRLGALAMHAVAEVGEERVAIVHGDAQSLAGWGFSQERLRAPEGRAAAAAALEAARARVIASSHTCLPVLQSFGAAGALVNNGSAGMPNFRGTRFGLASRISVRAARRPLYGLRIGRLHVDALALDYDDAAWQRRFLAQWPPGSDAYLSYHGRIVRGPDYALAQALRQPTPGAGRAAA